MTEFLTGQWPLGWSLAVFAVATAVTVVCSVRLAALGDALADRTGWGEALFGAVLFGLVTSLSGIVMTAVSAGLDQPRLACGNAVGGIAAQTVAIAVADAFLRGVNLEHAAASVKNMLFGCLLIGLLGISVMASLGPDVSVAGVHPASLAMVAFYLGGLRLIRGAGAAAVAGGRHPRHGARRPRRGLAGGRRTNLRPLGEVRAAGRSGRRRRLGGGAGGGGHP